ncbi:transketolase [Stenotrophomonas sp. S48]|uniref:transketolase n=1 Tax=unclassified Stenotrophomonas TaxID=196198 RepID=UPI0019025B0D|nr:MULTISPECIES: transketolase [unclassified Stenotrophomonas]MBK0024549.1 transketolase [Stenotrophomonas sp. S48]MBK0046662.1 transketolase [Stenotrophomonas sp. S49]
MIVLSVKGDEVMDLQSLAERSSPLAGPGVQPDGLEQEALELRRDIVHVLHHTGGGHYGGCLSVIDLLLVLYRKVLRIDPQRPQDPLRDRLVLSKGHAALALYAVLRRVGYFSDELTTYADMDSRLEGHPDMLALPGIDFSTGSLGQGLSVGVGMAHALKRSGQQVWVVLGDGECQEGQVWEAAMLASMCGLKNLHVVLDHNQCQEWGWNQVAAATPPPIQQVADKWAAFGWRVWECDGHDLDALQQVFNAMLHDEVERPSIIIANTVKGRGVSICEADPKRFHCDAATPLEHLQMVGDLA